MSEITLDMGMEISYAQLKERLENIAREYSLAVIEGVEQGAEYLEAAGNIRFLNDFIFEIECAIEETQIPRSNDK